MGLVMSVRDQCGEGIIYLHAQNKALTEIGPKELPLIRLAYPNSGLVCAISQMSSSDSQKVRVALCQSITQLRFTACPPGGPCMSQGQLYPDPIARSFATSLSSMDGTAIGTH